MPAMRLRGVEKSIAPMGRSYRSSTMSDISDYLRQHEAKPLLRFITCGSVDDGKSTLIGRLLYDSKWLFDDQLAALEKDSRRHGTQGERIDYALLLDGLPSTASGRHSPRDCRTARVARRTALRGRRPSRPAMTSARDHSTGAARSSLPAAGASAKASALVSPRARRARAAGRE